MKPLGLVWDRDRWYLAGQRLGKAEAPRLWRADRVLTIRNGAASAWGEAEFDVTHLLGRQWLREAMAQWSRESPVTIRLNTPQAERLRQDWYYGHARFERLSNDEWRMTYGEDNREYVFELLRWLGPEAELLEPQAWRAELREGLERMIAKYR
jgi:predicted DNA-binding transcriptional regulator YafY